MSSKFRRLEDLSFPVVHYKFLAKSLNGNELVEYRVQDLPPEQNEKAIDFMLKHFLPDEPFQQALTRDKDGAPRRLRYFYGEVVKSRVSLVCFEARSGDIVGMNMLDVESNVKENELENEKVSDVARALDYVKTKFDVFNHYQVDHYLNGFGLCVDEAYRGRGIATALLKARSSLLLSLNLTVTSTIFTSIGSQKAAASAGYEENFSIPYVEIQKKIPTLDFFNVATRECKIFSLEI